MLLFTGFDWGDEKSKNIKQETSQLEACRIFVNYVNYVGSGTNRQNHFEWDRQVDFKGESVEVNQSGSKLVCKIWETQLVLHYVLSEQRPRNDWKLSLVRIKLWHDCGEFGLSCSFNLLSYKYVSLAHTVWLDTWDFMDECKVITCSSSGSMH
jgi:hypothetical protein